MVTTSIPAELRAREQWVLWRFEEREGKRTKVPYRATDPSRSASTTNPTTWASFEEAVAASSEADGLGFVFTADDPFVGIDLDDAVDENGEVSSEAIEVRDRLDSYSELSPSGRGLHVIVAAQLTGSRRRTGGFEVYDSGRYFTVTGKRIGARETIEERQHELDDLLAHVFPPSTSSANGSAPRGETIPDDRDLLDRAFRARNGGKVEALWRGEVNGYGSQSEADLALCSALAFWTGRDPARLDRLFRGSVLMREKWDSPRGDSTYGAQTVEQALRRSEFYEPPPETPPAPTEPPTDSGHDPEAAKELADLLGLPSVGLKIVGARIVGPGSRASADLYLSDGTEVNFESLREVAHPTRLAVEITACTGATPALKAPMAQKALALLRRISERRESFTGTSSPSTGARPISSRLARSPWTWAPARIAGAPSRRSSASTLERSPASRASRSPTRAWSSCTPMAAGSFAPAGSSTTCGCRT